jgi:hypothetical protein
MSMQDIIAEYPQLSIEDIRAAIAYGAEMSRERFVEIPLEVVHSKKNFADYFTPPLSESVGFQDVPSTEPAPSPMPVNG